MNTESAKKMISYYLLVVGIKHPLLMFMPPLFMVLRLYMAMYSMSTR